MKLRRPSRIKYACKFTDRILSTLISSKKSATNLRSTGLIFFILKFFPSQNLKLFMAWRTPTTQNDNNPLKGYFLSFIYTV